MGSRGAYVAYNRIYIYVTALFSILFQVQIDPFGSKGPASWPILTEFRTDSISLVEESPKMKKQYCFGMYTLLVGDLYHRLLCTKNSGMAINNRLPKVSALMNFLTWKEVFNFFSLQIWLLF